TYGEKTINLNAYTGVIYIAFVMEQNGGDDWFIDDVSVNIICAAPSTQASNYSTTNINPTTGTASLNWTRGDGDNVLVVMRAGAAVNADPVNAATYTANSAFGSGQQLGTGNFVVYNGPATSVNVSALLENTTYHVAVYEYA